MWLYLHMIYQKVELYLGNNMYKKALCVFAYLLFFCVGYFVNFATMFSEYYILNKVQWACIETDPLSIVKENFKNCKSFRKNIL